MKNKDSILLEQAYESIYDKKQSKRISYRDDLNDYGDYVDKDRPLEGLPVEKFPKEVVEKYIKVYGLEEVKKYGIYINPVPFAVKVDWTSYDYPDDKEYYIENIELTAFQMKDEINEEIFTVQDPDEQYKMDLMLGEEIQKELIDDRFDDLREEIKNYNRENY